MKKILSLTFAIILLCACFAISANMADGTEGVTFNDINFLYSVENDLGKDPLTIEATIYFNKDKIKRNGGGTIFGNYNVFDETKCNFDIYIASGGAPVLRQRSFTNVYDLKFSNANVYTSEWVHLAIVRDVENNEYKCYINGELADTVSPPVPLKPVQTSMYRVASSNTFTNAEYFKGAIKSLAVYSDIRTDAEIKKDVTTLDKSDLLIAYDFTDKDTDRPEVIKDISGNNNNLKRNIMLYEEDIIDPSTYAYTFAVIGDTQSMAKNFTENFKDIYNYIYDYRDIMNIEAVIGLGDITDTKDGAELEWNAALHGLKIIDNITINIPIRGNHDNPYWYGKMMSKLNFATFTTKYQEGDLRNNYYATEIGGIPYLFLQIDYGPSDEILNWANNVVASHPNHNVIVSTHAYLTYDGTTLDSNDIHISNMANTADKIWDKFVKKHENIVLVLSGHIGTDYVVTTQRLGDKGNVITEMLLDYQSTDNAASQYSKISENGLGVVNFFHFSEDGKTVTVETISTVTGKKFMELNQLTLQLDTVTDKKYVKPDRAPTTPRDQLPRTEIKMTIDSNVAYVDGNAATLDAAPIIRNDRTMLPVRFVAENLGATVGWDAATQTVTVKGELATIEIKIGSPFGKVNGENFVLDSPAFIENSRTYLPVRVVAEKLGADVAWDDATKTATLSKLK
ncbi:MAG: metallophosphoesterase [Clostridia bacterium]|nr:metallophosphoesterase [Clostridia bacterium]